MCRQSSSVTSRRSSPSKRVLETDHGTSNRMRRTSAHDNPLERAFRSALFHEGIRFRIHYPVPCLPRRSIDVALTKYRVAIFLDGCFWHGCPVHGTLPVRNAGFWRAKIEGNRRRDQHTDEVLRAAGWRTVRVWEHEHLEEAVQRIRAVLQGTS